jgi:hypothetical protein
MRANLMGSVFGGFVGRGPAKPAGAAATPPAATQSQSDADAAAAAQAQADADAAAAAEQQRKDDEAAAAKKADDDKAKGKKGRADDEENDGNPDGDPDEDDDEDEMKAAASAKATRRVMHILAAGERTGKMAAAAHLAGRTLMPRKAAVALLETLPAAPAPAGKPGATGTLDTRMAAAKVPVAHPNPPAPEPGSAAATSASIVASARMAGILPPARKG